MPLSTALGCSLSALTGAFAAVCDPFDAAVAALSVYGAGGSVAGKDAKSFAWDKEARDKAEAGA
jgi:hydroxyethylthiazole kinase